MTLTINDTDIIDAHYNNDLYYADCHHGECTILFVVMLSVTILFVLSVVLLSLCNVLLYCLSWVL
jgi:hypothetical protein